MSKENNRREEANKVYYAVRRGMYYACKKEGESNQTKLKVYEACYIPVSYTHLDVYKRQMLYLAAFNNIIIIHNFYHKTR